MRRSAAYSVGHHDADELASQADQFFLARDNACYITPQNCNQHARAPEIYRWSDPSRGEPSFQLCWLRIGVVVACLAIEVGVYLVIAHCAHS